MPPCPCHKTGGTLSTGVFSPCCVTSHTGPTFSVISMRPSGRNAMRQGSLNDATCVTVNGRLGSGFCSPALTWASAVADTRVRRSAAFANVFICILPRETSRLTRVSHRARGAPNLFSVCRALHDDESEGRLPIERSTHQFARWLNDRGAAAVLTDRVVRARDDMRVCVYLGGPTDHSHHAPQRAECRRIELRCRA